MPSKSNDLFFLDHYIPHKDKTPSFLKSPRSCAIIGAPFTYGQPYYGLDLGPSASREHQPKARQQWDEHLKYQQLYPKQWNDHHPRSKQIDHSLGVNLSI